MRKLLFIFAFLPFMAFSQWSFLIPSDTITLLPTMTTIDSITSGYLSMRPQLSYASIIGQGAPTATTLGTYSGFTMPVWNNDAQQLFFREYIAGRWDGTSDITFSIVYVLGAAETVGEDISWSLAWSNKSNSSGVISATPVDTVTVIDSVRTDRTAQYAIYNMNFTVPWNGHTPNIAAGDEWSARLRRNTASGDPIDSNPILIDARITYKTDKVYKQN